MTKKRRAKRVRLVVDLLVTDEEALERLAFAQNKEREYPSDDETMAKASVGARAVLVTLFGDDRWYEAGVRLDDFHFYEPNHRNECDFISERYLYKVVPWFAEKVTKEEVE